MTKVDQLRDALHAARMDRAVAKQKVRDAEARMLKILVELETAEDAEAVLSVGAEPVSTPLSRLARIPMKEQA